MSKYGYSAVENLSVDHLSGAQGVTQKIKGAMKDAAKQFVYIGFLLWEVKHYEYFYEGNYGSVYEYAEAELGFKRSSTKNFIAICETFCRKNESFKELPTMFLDDRWSDFQYSQLTEMLSMSAAQRQKSKPDMTVKQLRQLKKIPTYTTFNEETGKIETIQRPEEAIGQTSGQKKTTLEEIARENERLSDLYCTEGNPTTVNDEEATVTHYLLTELCRLAGIKYIDYEDYEISIKLKDEPEQKRVNMKSNGYNIEVNDASKPYNGPELMVAGLSIDSGLHAALKQETLENLCEIACMKFNKKGRYHIAIYEEAPGN